MIKSTGISSNKTSGQESIEHSVIAKLEALREWIETIPVRTTGQEVNIYVDTSTTEISVRVEGRSYEWNSYEGRWVEEEE